MSLGTSAGRGQDGCMRSTRRALGLLVVVAVAAASCGGGRSASTTRPTGRSSTSTTSATSATSATSTTSTTTTTVVVRPLPDGIGGAVVSPTGNIACGIYFASTSDLQKVHCATFSPPRTADMSVSGTVTTCSGSACALGNPAPGTPVLAYGTATGVGPFRCASATTGMTCTVTGGRGFTISRSGIALLGG